MGRRPGIMLAEKAALQDGAESKAQLAESTDALRDLMHTHGILLASRDLSLVGLVQSVALHMEDMRAKADAHARAADEWDALRTKLELDIRAGMDKRETLFGELEEARKARDEAKAQVRELELQLRVCSSFVLCCFVSHNRYPGRSQRTGCIGKPTNTTGPR